MTRGVASRVATWRELTTSRDGPIAIDRSRDRVEPRREVRRDDDSVDRDR